MMPPFMSDRHSSNPHAKTVLQQLTKAGLRVNKQADATILSPRPTNAAEPAGPVARLGRYTITGHLGAGGMGEVLQVRDEDVGREMAAKVILGAATGPALAKFIQEAQITGQLEHPNIVPMHELGMTEDDRVYFTMKRVEGETLEELLDAERKDEGGRRRYLIKLLNIFLKICDAIAFAHSRGVIHRDLKPANIMVGRFGEVQLMDWGLAKVIGQVGEATSAEGRPALDVSSGRFAPEHTPLATLAGSVMGTPAYMPPEQARGEVEKFGCLTDIYSLGALLYEILTLEPPYVGTEPPQGLE
ncbi:serine/threonine protein kinase [Acidimicrobium ferrooxidans]|nr:serine/threonine protein kinase [Acidimicrobium ferrooxidans]